MKLSFIQLCNSSPISENVAPELNTNITKMLNKKLPSLCLPFLPYSTNQLLWEVLDVCWMVDPENKSHRSYKRTSYFLWSGHENGLLKTELQPWGFRRGPPPLSFTTPKRSGWTQSWPVKSPLSTPSSRFGSWSKMGRSSGSLWLSILRLKAGKTPWPVLRASMGT